MKEYILLKKYPSLPKNWEPGMIVGQGDRGSFGKYSPCAGTYEDFYLERTEVETNPEFWEEINEKKSYPVGTKVRHNETNVVYTKNKENKWDSACWKNNKIPDYLIGEGKRFKLIEEVKDYEILSFELKTDFISCIRYKNKWGKFPFCDNKEESWNSKENEFSEEELLSEDRNYYKIHSIKRLRDNSVFSIGDETNFGKITGFEIHNNTIRVQYYIKGNWQWLSSIEKAKPVLFTTEDGVSLTKDDKWHPVCIEEGLGFIPYKITNFKWTGIPAKGFKAFSTKEAAEKYLILNKPCLSISDIESTYFKEENIREQLKKLVKSKL